MTFNNVGHRLKHKPSFFHWALPNAAAHCMSKHAMFEGASTPTLPHKHTHTYSHKHTLDLWSFGCITTPPSDVANSAWLTDVHNPTRIPRLTNYATRTLCVCHTPGVGRWVFACNCCPGLRLTKLPQSLVTDDIHSATAVVDAHSELTCQHTR